MMQPVHTADSVRQAEQAFFTAHPDVDLMGRAAHEVAQQALAMLHDDPRDGGGQQRVVVLVGQGNNGGDGLFAAAELAGQGIAVELVTTGENFHEQGMAAAEQAGCTRVELVEATERLAEAALVIDAVFGIGGRPGLPATLATLAEEVEALGVPVLAVDLPSGLDTDSGRADEASFRATRTVTFATHKPCHVMEPAAGRCGEVVVADIGLELGETHVHLLEAADVAAHWPWPSATSDKYSRGVVGIDTGSVRYPGAAILGTNGAVHAGAGMIRFVGADSAADRLRSLLPSVTYGEGKVQAWLVGSGWGQTEANHDRLSGRLVDHLPCVIDADALAVLPDELPDNCLLTPHAGELSKLLGVKRQEVEADPVGHARQAATRSGTAVLLKGATQYCVSPEGDVLVAVPGPHWTAQAGSGDVLAGICSTLLAAGLDAHWAGALGASVQALCAEQNPGPFPPDEIARRLPATIASLQH